MKLYGVYKITNTLNGKYYVGSGNLATRKYDHFRWLCLGKHFNQHLQRAFDKYGKNSLYFSVLLVCEHSLCAWYEDRYIKRWALEEDLYNIALDVVAPLLGRKHTDMAVAKIRASKMGEKNPMFGRGYLIAGKKHPMFGRTGEKSPTFGRGDLHIGEKNGMFGKHHTDVAIQKMRAKALLRSVKNDN